MTGCATAQQIVPGCCSVLCLCVVHLSWLTGKQVASLVNADTPCMFPDMSLLTSMTPWRHLLLIMCGVIWFACRPLAAGRMRKLHHQHQRQQPSRVQLLPTRLMVVVVLLLVPAAPAQNLAVTHQQQQLQQLQPHSRRQLVAVVVVGASASRVAPGHLAVFQHPLPQYQLLGCPQLPLPSQEASRRRSAAAAPPPRQRERRRQEAGAPAATQQQQEEVDRGPPCSPTSHQMPVPSRASGLCLSTGRCPTAPATKPTAAATALALSLALSLCIRACHLPTGLCAMPLEGPSSVCHPRHPWHPHLVTRLAQLFLVQQPLPPRLPVWLLMWLLRLLLLAQLLRPLRHEQQRLLVRPPEPSPMQRQRLRLWRLRQQRVTPAAQRKAHQHGPGGEAGGERPLAHHCCHPSRHRHICPWYLSSWRCQKHHQRRQVHQVHQGHQGYISNWNRCHQSRSRRHQQQDCHYHLQQQ